MATKKLARPNQGITTKEENTDDLAQKREEAKRRAQNKARARTLARQQALAERMATATSQLATAMNESASAAEELGKTMDTIAAAAEEAANNSDTSKTAIQQIKNGAITANQVAGESLERVNGIQKLIRATSEDIDKLIAGVDTAADKNIESAKLIVEMEKQSDEIGAIVTTVVRIADQTNLLALNAAIEAARAGEHGRGFAVVADEVRNLAETSEQSARNISNVVQEIQEQVKTVAKQVEDMGVNTREEVEKAKTITADLSQIEKDVVEVQEGANAIDTNAEKAQEGAEKFLAGAENIAAAANQAASACEEAGKSVDEQTKAFTEMNIAVDELQEQTEELKTSTDTQKSAEVIAAMAEELSSNAEESNAASGQIMTAIEQISKGATQIQESADVFQELGERLETASKGMAQRSEMSVEKVTAAQELLAKNKVDVENMIQNIGKSADDSLDAAKAIKALGEKTRQIDKIVDAIVNVTIQTNMLAVNGSIEAARAGEFGRGFSVVAGDIRTLANESAENADKIKDMVRNIQDQIVNVASDIDGSALSARQEADNAQKCTVNLNQIEADASAVLSGVQGIGDITTEALTALEQANKAVVEIATAAQESAASAGEAAKAAEEGNRAMQLITDAIEDIASQADEMQNM